MTTGRINQVAALA